MPIDLRLAAIIALLSSAALRGASCGKVEALREHLEAAALSGAALDANLRRVLEDALAQWLSVDCQRPSVALEYRPVNSVARMLH